MKYIENYLTIIASVIMTPFVIVLVTVIPRKRYWNKLHEYKWTLYLFVIGLALLICYTSIK